MIFPLPKLSLLAHPTLKITLEQSSIFLHPNGDPEKCEDAIIRGQVNLFLCKAAVIRSMKVSFKGVCNTIGGSKWPYESSTPILQELVLDLGVEKQAAGNHAFAFSFIIPQSAAVHERSQYGQIKHSIHAVAMFRGMKRKIETEVPVILNANPSEVGEPPESFDVVVRAVRDSIGPIGMSLASPHLTVSALLSMRISFFSPPELSIQSITTYVQQAFEITYSRSDRIAHPVPQRHLLYHVDHMTPASSSLPLSHQNLAQTGYPSRSDTDTNDTFIQLEAGQEFTYERLVRLPDDNYLRATTLLGTKTNIRVTHKIVAEIRYHVHGSSEGAKVLTMAKVVSIASCCCLLDSLLLPAYAEKAPNVMPVQQLNSCACMMSLKELLARDGGGFDSGGSSAASESSSTRSRSSSINEGISMKLMDEAALAEVSE